MGEDEMLENEKLYEPSIQLAREARMKIK